MKRLPFEPEGTKQSRLLCEEISRRSDGICILAFSRGKDSIPAWVWLRRFFHTIHVYHLAAAPNLGYVERSLQTYEKIFDTKILRFIDGEVIENIQAKSFQFLQNYPLIDSFNLPKGYYHYAEVADVVRKKFNCPQAWHAMAMLGCDNIFRRLNLLKKDSEGNLTYTGAIHEGRQTFYPTFDWKLDQNLEVIEKNGFKLPDDYKMAERTVNSIPSPQNIDRLYKDFPEDFEKIQSLFPLVKSVWARCEFRRMKAGVVPIKTVKDVL